MGNCSFKEGAFLLAEHSFCQTLQRLASLWTCRCFPKWKPWRSHTIWVPKFKPKLNSLIDHSYSCSLFSVHDSEKWQTKNWHLRCLSVSSDAKNTIRHTLHFKVLNSLKNNILTLFWLKSLKSFNLFNTLVSLIISALFQIYSLDTLTLFHL